MKTDMAIKPKTLATDPVTKESYPTLTFRDKQVDNLEKALGELPELDAEEELMVTVKCSGVRKDEYGKSVDFKVLSVAPCDDGEKDDKDEGEDEGEDEPAPMADMKGVKNPAMKKAMAKMMENEK
jgi:hypothetical protein